jgi:hypothetical protein
MGSVADRCKYLLRIHLTSNVRKYSVKTLSLSVFTEYLPTCNMRNMPRCTVIGINSPLPFVLHGAKARGMARGHSPRHPLFTSTLVRRRHYHHLCTVVFAHGGICALSLVTGSGRAGPGARCQRRPEHSPALGNTLRRESSRNAGKPMSGRSAIPGRVDSDLPQVGGQWMYLYRAVDKQGNTVGSYPESNA